jgi:F-type H+-transporting ATPase subunit epsilon
MPPTFDVEIVTPDRTEYSGDAVSLVAPAIEGYLGVLANHAPLLTALGVGEARVTGGDGRPTYFAVSGGFLEVADNRAILLADAAERADRIDVNRAEEARRRAEETRETVRSTDPAFATAEAALVRAINRLHVAREHGRGTE